MRMKKQKGSNKKGNAIIIFMAFMAIMTIVSRIVDSYMIPQVSIGLFQEMKLKYPVEIEGRIKTVEKQAVYCRENLRVENVFVQKNDIVQKGDLLFSIDMDDLHAKIGQMEREVQKYELQIADMENAYQEQVNQQSRNLNPAKEEDKEILNITADDAVSSGEEALKIAARQTEDAGAEVKRDNSITLLQMETEDLKKDIQQLYEIRQKNGCIFSGFNGRIFECNISAGSMTALEPVIVLEDFNRSFQFEGTINENVVPYVENGMECTLEMKYGKDVLEGVKISEVVEGEEGTCRVVAEINTDLIHQTGEAVLSFTKESRRYSNCIPLSALYNENTGCYVIEVKEDYTILGIQSVAEYVPVTLIESNDEYAAVEGNVSENGKIVVDADKTIKEGDRVKVIED